jgi:hypothetical protein
MSTSIATRRHLPLARTICWANVRRVEEDEGVRPQDQRGGTTADEQEGREKGEWVEQGRKGVVPDELGGSDAPEEMLEDDPELKSESLGRTTGDDTPATEEGIDRTAGDEADAVTDGGATAPDDEEPDLKDIGGA